MRPKGHIEEFFFEEITAEETEELVHKDLGNQLTNFTSYAAEKKENKGYRKFSTRKKGAVAFSTTATVATRYSANFMSLFVCDCSLFSSFICLR